MKQYIGISRDHSGSMEYVAPYAMKDFNEQVSEIKGNAIRFGIDTILSVMSCSIGSRTRNEWDTQLSSIAAVSPIRSYDTSGNSTKLWDCVDEMIEHFKRVPDYNSDDVAFTLLILTDGADNASIVSGASIGQKIREMQATDKWTITFRVPAGMKASMVCAGIPAGNILEVDYSDEESIEKATIIQKKAIAQAYTSRLSGIRGSSSFYVDVNADTATVRRELSNISKKVKVVRVTQADDKSRIDEFMQNKTGSYKLGTVFYQLTKREEVQDNKRFIVWDKNSGEYYTGAEARSLLNLPSTGTIKLVPGSMNQFEVFVQSNSVNRKLVGGTKVVVYEAT